MANEKLTIDCRWLAGGSGGPLERGFSAEIALAVGENCLTLLEDLEAKTVRPHMRGCAHRLATWFAANWWRLRWEPETRQSRQDPDWRMAHGLASAGGGFVWPNVLFASDGDSLAVASIPMDQRSPLEPVRYLNRILSRITAAEFERQVDAFLESILSRSHSLGLADDPLPTLWAEVLAERRDPAAAQWRKLEALCGYDPGEAPPALIDTLAHDQAGLGLDALEELAAEGRHATAALLAPILEIAKADPKRSAGTIQGSLPTLPSTPPPSPGSRPWQQASRLARHARQAWDLGAGPLSNKQLAKLLGAKPTLFDAAPKADAPLPLLLRGKSNGAVEFHLNRQHPTSRRFAACRLVGDHLHRPSHGRLIPATEVKTARQQFQRAFAQELLCPHDALRDFLNTEHPTDDAIQEAAAHFQVSTRVVETTLVNKGELDREALSWTA